MNMLTRDLLAQLAAPPAAIRESKGKPAPEDAAGAGKSEAEPEPDRENAIELPPALDAVGAEPGDRPEAGNEPDLRWLAASIAPDTDPAPAADDRREQAASPAPAAQAPVRSGPGGGGTGAAARESGSIVHEPDSGRRHIRIRMPIDVTIDGAVYRAADWSLSGMKVEDIDSGLEPGEVFASELAVPFPGFKFSTAVTCELVYNDRERRYIGCKFLDLAEGQVELLRYLVDAYLSDRVATVDGLFRVAGKDVGVRDRSGGLAPELPLARRIGRWTGLAVRYGLLFAVGVALVLATGTAVHTKVLTVDATYAAVAAPTVEMRAPATGHVVGRVFKPGDRVAAGSVLLEVRDTALAGELAIARSDLRRELAGLAALRKKLGDRRAFFSEYMLLARAALTKAVAERERATTALDIARRISRRADVLRRQGAVAEQEAEQARVAEARAERESRVAEAAQAEAESNLRMAREGYFFTGTRVRGGERGDIERAIKLAEGAVATAGERVEALKSRLTDATVRSPCDCLVHAASVEAGEWIDVGRMAYVLRQDRSDAMIEALVVQERADEIEIGAVADVKLADREEFIRAKVVDVNRGRQSRRRMGVPDHYRKSAIYAVVLLAPEASLTGVPIGLPAKVRLPSSRKTVLLDLFDRDVVAALIGLVEGVTGWFGGPVGGADPAARRSPDGAAAIGAG